MSWYARESSIFELVGELVCSGFKSTAELILLVLPYNIQRKTSSTGRPVYFANSSTEIYWWSSFFRCFFILIKYLLAWVYSFPIMRWTSFGYMHTLPLLVPILHNWYFIYAFGMALPYLNHTLQIYIISWNGNVQLLVLMVNYVPLWTMTHCNAPPLL